MEWQRDPFQLRGQTAECRRRGLEKVVLMASMRQ